MLKHNFQIKMQLAKQDKKDPKTIKNKKRRKISHKMDRLLNTPGASQKLMTSTPQTSRPQNADKLKNRRKMRVKKSMQKMGNILESQHQRLKVLYI
jgi:hypothetical protein